MLKYYAPDDRRGYASLAIKFPMNGATAQHPTRVFNLSYTTEEQAVSNYINLLLTRKGERFMQPLYGIGIQEYLFEQNVEDTRDLLEDVILRETQYWLPYINVVNLQVLSGQDVDNSVINQSDNENALIVRITFSTTEVGANKVITIFTQDGGVVRANVEEG